MTIQTNAKGNFSWRKKFSDCSHPFARSFPQWEVSTNKYICEILFWIPEFSGRVITFLLAVHNSSIGDLVTHSLCFIVQMKLSQDICVPKSCNNKQTGLCLLDVYLLSLMWSQIRESWTRNGGGPWRRGCEAFLCAVPGSSKPYTARSHEYNILYVCWFVCLDMWNIWISKPKVQMACRAHVQIKTTGAQGIESALGEMSPNYMV